jgi:hypothetical protein
MDAGQIRTKASNARFMSSRLWRDARSVTSSKARVFCKLIYQTYEGYVMSQFKKLEQGLRPRCEAPAARSDGNTPCTLAMANSEMRCRMPE